jgi:hypothetical protein
MMSVVYICVPCRRTPAPALVFQKGIILAFLADRGLRAVAGNDDGVIRKGEQFVVQGIDDLLERAAGKIGSTDASRKQRITCD